MTDDHDQKSRGPEYRRGFADGLLAERAKKPYQDGNTYVAPVGPPASDRRLCPMCGHEGRRGDVDVVLGADEVATWPVAADIYDGIYTRGDASLCSRCGTVTVAYVPTGRPTPDDERWATLLQPDALAALAAHVASCTSVGAP